jgi:hypothetical protein
VDTETPRPEKLVLDLDTTVNSSPTDISGKGNHGTFNGNAQYSAADKAFTFDGTDDYIISQSISGTYTGAFVHSLCVWAKFNTGTGNAVLSLGTFVGSNGTSTIHANGSGTLNSVFNGNSVNFTTDMTTNTWYFIVITYDGGSVASSRRAFVNGEEVSQSGTSGTITSLSLSTNPHLYIGGQSNGNQDFNGMISNPKIYSVALEPSEVKKLYNLGRTGRSMVISDTAVGIGKVPEAQLDVRGTLAVRGGNVMIEEDTIKVRLATDPGYLSQISGGSMRIDNPSTSGGYEHFIMNNSTTGTHKTTYFSFRRNNTQIGSILTNNGSTISFNTGSDYRLKENIVPMSNEGLVVINKLQPKTFNFKTNPGETVYGFIAHELQEHIPIAVSGEKDEMRGEEPMYQGVDMSKIVPYLVKAVQELYEENQAEKAKNETLETQVSDLLARVTALENA